MTTNWSRKADASGNLIFDASATAELTTKNSGNYAYHYFTKTSVDTNTYYSINKYGETHSGSSDSHSENTTTTDVSENYDSELKETWAVKSGDSSFTLRSRTATLDGFGDSLSELYHYDESDTHEGWDSEFAHAFSDYSSQSQSRTRQTAEYSYDADWDGISSGLNNRITGEKEISNDWHRHSNYEGYGLDCDYNEILVADVEDSDGDSSLYSEYEYDETVHATGFGSGYTNIYNQVWYNQFSGGGARDSYNKVLPNAHGTGSGGYGNNIDPKTDKIAAGELTVGKPETGQTGRPDIPEEVPPVMEPLDLNNVPGFSAPLPDESWWYAGLKAGVGTFIHGAGTMAYDFANHVSVGSINSERYHDQVNAQGERLYNVAKNLGYSDASIANGYGLAQAVAGEAFGTNALAEAGTGYDLGTNTTLDGWERAQKAAQGTAQVAGTLAGAFKATGVNPRLTGTKKSFMEMMSQEDATRYQKYWNDAKLKQYTPGIRELHRTQVSKDGRYTYDTVSHFDEYGRLIGETHFSTHPSTPLIHPNPHHHKIIYSSEFPLGRKLKQILEGTYEP